MTTTDKNEWRLRDTNLTTDLGIIPAGQSHLYKELNEPGSGELRLPMDTTKAGQITSGMFAECYYRGSSRGGFFIENIKNSNADAGEYGGRWMSISGRGALALLEDAIVWDDSTTNTTRDFTSVTKASILITLITEAKARGALANLTYDFSASVDSAAVAWTDSEHYKLPVGTSLLDVARQFAKTGGFDYEINLVGANFVLSAYSAGSGSDLSETMFMRTGTNCEEVSSDERGDGINNALRVKYKSGYVTVSDSTSITNRRRREKLLPLEQAQSSASATTYAAAKIAQTKDPKNSIAVRVYDGVAPRLFVDYDMGDYITLDVLGTETRYRVLGIQADFDGVDFSHVVLELNTLLYDKDMEMSQDLDWLLDQWNTAKDANLQEVNQWLPMGAPNGIVKALYSNSGLLYVGGEFTVIGGVPANHIATYNFITGAWAATDAAGIAENVLGIIAVGFVLYAITQTKIYAFTGTWSLIGTTSLNLIHSTCLATDGTNLFVGGSFAGIDAVATFAVATWDGAVWNNTFANTMSGSCYGLVWFNGKLYGAFQNGLDDFNYVAVCTAGTWAALFPTIHKDFRFILTANDKLYFLGVGATPLYEWDGVAAAPTNIGEVILYTSVEDFVARNGAIASYLTDVYISGVQYGGLRMPMKYSGGEFSQLGDGTNAFVLALAVNNSDVYVGGDFTDAGGKSISYLSVFVNDFQSMVNHLSNDGSFDMGAAIHGADASAITDNDEVPFWEDVANSLRKITWANIKAFLKTYFDTLYQVLNANLTTIAGLTATTDNFIQSKSSAWASRTIAQVKTDLGLTGTNSGDQTGGTPALTLGTDNTAGAAATFIRTNDTILAFDATSPSTQAFADSAVVGTATVAARRDHKHAMMNAPTSVSGNAGTATALQTARTIDGQSFDGAANITVIAPGTHAATSKVTPVDADEVPLVDSEASNVLKKLTWANLKATLKTYFDPIYAGFAQGVTNGDSHDHVGGDGAQIGHTGLANIGTNTHASIDTHLANTSNPHTTTDANLSTSDITTNDASTTKHGFLIKATAPAASLMNVPGIVNGESVWTNKPIFDATNPAAIGTAAPGTSLIAAHRDHVHAGTAASVAAIPNDGWTAIAGTFTFASTSTINVASGAASIYTKGDKLKWVTATGSAQRYATIITVADTLLTIIVNTSHVLVNEAWTVPFYSHAASPVGFPTTFNFTPVVTGATSGAPTYTVTSCSFSTSGGVGRFNFDITINTVATAVGSIKVTTPWAHTVGAGAGRENAVTGNMLQIQANLTAVTLFTYNNGTTTVAGYQLIAGCLFDF